MHFLDGNLHIQENVNEMLSAKCLGLHVLMGHTDVAEAI